jgi:hypothetical protein
MHQGTMRYVKNLSGSPAVDQSNMFACLCHAHIVRPRKKRSSFT